MSGPDSSHPSPADVNPSAETLDSGPPPDSQRSTGNTGSTGSTGSAIGSSNLAPTDWPSQYAEPATPEQIGVYRILSRIGEGGIGVVYKAEQREPVKRIVALKLIKLGMDTREVVARFSAERQALAMMDHPNVARVFDGGSTSTGRPYFVMELVAGEPITDYCDRHSLTTRQRLELFIQVCGAVQHAHTKGIIHRDLKPSNILVGVKDGAALAKVIDFGIAKALTSRLTDRTLYTEQGQLIGTPEYMSPEQAEMSAVDIDTRSDIYSLGVLLYELLAGAPPVDSKTLRRAAYAEIQRMIRELDPPSPSLRVTRMGKVEGAKIAEHRRVTITELCAELKRELEWIPLKAMKKDRTERYQTAKDLATDVENYLNGLPLAAGPETTIYRARKFVKRNSVAVGVVGVMFVLLVSMLIAVVMLLKTNRERLELITQKFEQEKQQQQLVAQKDEAERLRIATEKAMVGITADIASRIKDPQERMAFVRSALSQMPVGPGGALDPGMVGSLLRIGAGAFSRPQPTPGAGMGTGASGATMGTNPPATHPAGPRGIFPPQPRDRRGG